MTGSRRAWLWLWVAALLASQALGLAHRIAHGPAGYGQAAAGKPGSLASHGLVTGVREAAPVLRVLPALFSGHESDDPSCRVYDQASHGDAAVPVLPAALPALVSRFLLQCLQGEALARWAAQYDARGPPPVR